MNDQLYMSLIRLLPKELFSDTLGALARAALPQAMQAVVVRRFARAFGVNTTEMERPLDRYTTLDEFFTRRLVAGARPIDPTPASLVSPADGQVGAFGKVEGFAAQQIKGKTYSVEKLLGDSASAKPFVDGNYLTVYLSPKDYHRVHFPIAGTVTRYKLIPGHFFPVNAPSVRQVPELFAVNERFVVFLETPAPVAVVMVAAVGVGSISPSFLDDSHAFRKGLALDKTVSPGIPVEKGQEMGMFHLGSTAVVLTPKGYNDWDELGFGQDIRMGERIGLRRGLMP